jgi:phospholipid/cholesterol/gamma-HCH transport system substrate-binding protein
MKSKSIELVVGLFFILGLGAIFILTFRVASLSGAAPGTAYSVNATFANVGGLKPGAAVTMAGMRIGRVREISMERDTYEARVRLEIDNTVDNIPRDSSARILTAGLLGEQYVGLEPGGDDQWLRDNDVIHITQSALVLENIVGQFVTSAVSSAAKDASK